LIVHERLEIGKAVGILSNLVKRVSLLAGPFEERTEFVRVDTANVHFFVEGTTVEGGSVDVVVPRQIQVVDLFDRDRSGDHICGDSNAPIVYWRTLIGIHGVIK
jgi:hypothetical protein